MKTRWVLFLLILSVAMFLRFTPDNPYFKINSVDVELHYPSYFPKPTYNFSQNKITPEGFTLGRRLFYDPILSKDYFISCASCHQQFAAFAHVDHTLAHGIYGRIGNRNAPGIQNLIWKDAFMQDGGITHLDLQPLAPITNSLEMDESLVNIIQKLKKDSSYVNQFYLAFGDSNINTKYIMKAFSQFMGLMISCNAKYDKVKQDKTSFKEDELAGYKLFKKNCASCHVEPLFTNNTYQINGVPIDTSLLDSGRIKITGNKDDFLKFKVPTLRNCEVTYPYMHDGRFRKLKDVVSFYVNNASNTINPLLKKIKLTDEEQKELVAFLLTLTDKEFLHDRRFMDPNL